MHCLFIERIFVLFNNTGAVLVRFKNRKYPWISLNGCLKQPNKTVICSLEERLLKGICPDPASLAIVGSLNEIIVCRSPLTFQGWSHGSMTIAQVVRLGDFFEI